MGPGKADLLEAIKQTGSISASAKSMRMSYRRAWELVDVMNRSFDLPVVETSPGGAHGGGAMVTEFGELLLHRYHSLVEKTNVLAVQELADIVAHIKP
jgi:molybdate transport system regulatory protein